MELYKTLRSIDNYIERRFPEGHGYFIIVRSRLLYTDITPRTLTNLERVDAYSLVEDWLDDYINAAEHYEKATKWEVLQMVKMHILYNIPPEYDFVFLARALPGYGDQQMRAISDMHPVDAFNIIDDWYRNVYDKPDTLDNL